MTSATDMQSKALLKSKESNALAAVSGSHSWRIASQSPTVVQGDLELVGRAVDRVG